MVTSQRLCPSPAAVWAPAVWFCVTSDERGLVKCHAVQRLLLLLKRGAISPEPTLLILCCCLNKRQQMSWLEIAQTCYIFGGRKSGLGLTGLTARCARGFAPRWRLQGEACSLTHAGCGQNSLRGDGRRQIPFPLCSQQRPKETFRSWGPLLFCPGKARSL